VSVTAGAVLAGASPEDVRACEIYAEKIGLAFQSEDLS
jgi:geranylgeranyl pyrophosphate synthase